MKRNTTLIRKYLSLSLFVVLSCNQSDVEKDNTILITEIKNDISKNRLNGKIKSITSVKKEIIETFKGYKESVSKKNWGEYRSQSKNQYYTYNIYGINRLNNYYLQDSYVSFNKFGNIDSIYGFQNKKLVSTTIYEYDTSNVLISEKWYGNKETLKYETIFNNKKNGNLESKTFQYPNKQLEASLNYIFDENHNLKSLTVDKNDKKNECHNYKYDSLNNLVESSRFDYSGYLLMKSAYKYNHLNALIERKIFEAKDAILKSHTSYRYKYDDYDNWIEQVYYKNDAIPYILIKRTIEYY